MRGAAAGELAFGERSRGGAGAQAAPQFVHVALRRCAALAWLQFGTRANPAFRGGLYDDHGAKVPDVTEGDCNMPESKNDFRKALGSVIDASTREATRQVSRRFEHQLIGAVTKRPN